MRQRGKVAELALGFGGSTGALQAMAAGYGLHLEDADALQTVTRWREANPWCVAFWQALGDAADAAMRLRRPQRVGRVVYSFAPGYLGGSLFCELPSGRLLTYRALRYERVEEKDDDGRVIGRRRQLRFSRDHGRVKLWHGMLCENIVQAVAADVLRGTLVKLERLGARVRLHTHDEVLVECDRENADGVADGLRAIMREGFDWSRGLPLMSEETRGYYYTKHEGSHGL
jgi:DNA polymerase